ncbi:hypothetical protein CC78DRAFT_548426 [Lojkania enalia]|uniref:Uncharacterized protein n=1 Tax=Lojkania enalia TaxID=147567 RepID=A0A9P4K397_9PLEO|nr:hypothetical protein CC78DRAFT_548426 [Didymosphaeria enalia]
MPLRSSSKSYINLHGLQHDREYTPWYWRFIALTASWMILGGYLILPGLYTKEPELKLSTAVLSVFVVALLTAGYSFTALLCFACRNEIFQAEGIFLPSLASSAIGVLTFAYNFASSRRFQWNTAAITGTAISCTSTVLYAILFFWTHRRIVRKRAALNNRSANLWSEQSFYTNFLQNMYPSATRPGASPTPELHLSEDDRINQQMAMLLMKTDSGPSPDAASATFRIDLPDDREERERMANSQELLGTPPTAHQDYNRSRANSGPESLNEEQAWERWHRGRAQNRPSSTGGQSTHSRAISREERRREIEMGR